ncbi:MAG: TIGR01244 family phosphatase [Burkholderiaceae bacterium]|nr:TIGR01244 family phosphatase [Burkholderiaceae bacterium]
MSDYIRPINQNFAVAPQLGPEHMAEVAFEGYRSVIVNRPDFEGGVDQPTYEAVAEAARAAGLSVEYQPVEGNALTIGDAIRFAEQLKTLPGPVLAYCRSGTRCQNLYSAAQQFM